MFRKFLLIPTILSLACLFVIADSAQAQRRGGSGGGRGGISIGVGGGRGYGGYGNNWYGNNLYGSRYYSPGWGGGYGYRSYPGYYSSSSVPTYSYYMPSTDYYSSYADQYQYLPPQDTSYAQQNPNTAQLRVLLPDPQARVWLNGSPTQQTGTDRLFQTPPLDASTTNSYTVRAAWNQGGREMSQERIISVTPGRMATVDFTQQIAEPIRPQAQPVNPAPPNPARPLSQDTVLEGKILRTAQDQFVIQTLDKREVTVYTNPQTRFTINNNPGAFTDLRTGANVNVNFRMDGTRYIGNTITIRP